MKYTPEQKRAIESVEKDTVVTAGAGAGKTRVLVDRILYILEKGLAQVDEIVAITYTIKAALEIRERLRKALKGKPIFREALEKLGIAYIGTIHSFCLRILQENPVAAGIDPDVAVLEEYRAKAMISESLRQAILENLEDPLVYDLTKAMTGLESFAEELTDVFLTIRNQGLKPDFEVLEDPSSSTISRLLSEGLRIYEDKKKSLEVIDFEDILQKTRDLLDHHPEVTRYYHRKLKFIMVDEYQDLNFVQDHILRRLGEVPNLFVVGDKKQSIYGFRGARVELFEKLLEDLKQKGKYISMDTNFRSHGNILDFVNTSFENLMCGYEKICLPKEDVRGSGVDKVEHNIGVLMPPSEGNMPERRQREGEIIADKILEMLQDGTKVFDPGLECYRNPTFGDFALLLRRKTHLKAYIEALEKRKIPYVVAVGESLVSKPVVKGLLQALKVVAYRDQISLYGTLTWIFAIPHGDLYAFVEEYDNLLAGILEEVDWKKLSPELGRAMECIKSWIQASETSALRELLDMILRDAQLLHRSDIQEIEDIMKFKDLLEDADEEGQNLEGFLEEIKSFGEEQGEASLPEDSDAVKITTIHSSKGLEFHVVFIADCSDDLKMKTSKILFDPELGIGVKDEGDKWEEIKGKLEQREKEEAQRLLYVAMTRARDYLLISGEERDKVKDKKNEWFLKWIEPYIDDKVSLETSWDKPIPKMIPQMEEEPSEIMGFRPCSQSPITSLSTTALGEYLRCPRRFYISQVLKVPEGVFYSMESGKATKTALTGAERGSLVHSLIEASLNGEIDLERLVAQEKLPAGIQATLEDEEYIFRCLRHFLQGDYFSGYDRVYSESPFIYPIEDRLYITGVIDGLGVRGGEAVLVDFKTNRQIDDALLPSYELQLQSYALALRDIMGYEIKKAGIASLYEGIWYDIDVTTRSLEKHRQKLVELAHEVMEARDLEDFPPGVNCHKCGYKGKIC